MAQVSTFRLYILRATYLFIVIGLGAQVWPGIVSPPAELEHTRSVIRSFLAGVSLIALLGLRYPLEMLPLLLLELGWKSVWLLAFGLPHWLRGTFTAASQQTWFDCLLSVVIFALAIPWGYVWRRYARTRGVSGRFTVTPEPHAQHTT